MAFKRPSYNEIIDRVKTDVESQLETGKLLPRSTLSYICNAFSGAVHGLYGFIDWATKQIFPDTATAENLERWADIYGLSRKQASFATGVLTFTGENGSVIPENTAIRRKDGLTYYTSEEVTISDGSASASVTCDTAGTNGNTASSTELSLETSIEGIDTTATVDSDGITGGGDIENDALLRSRLLTRIKKPPYGGSEHDYELWALEVPNITRAYVKPLWAGLGTVAVYVIDDDGATAPIPDSETLQAVTDYIEEQRPVTADVSVFAPTPKELDITLSITPDSTATRQAVEANLKDMLRRDAAPGATIYLSRIREAVSIATGENDNTVTSPSADFTTATGEIAVLGDITWT